MAVARLGSGDELRRHADATDKLEADSSSRRRRYEMPPVPPPSLGDVSTS